MHACLFLISFSLFLLVTLLPHLLPLTWMLMSELLISDWVVELLEDWDAELPSSRDSGHVFVIGESVSSMFTDGGSVAGSSAVGEGVGGTLSVADPSVQTSVMEQKET